MKLHLIFIGNKFIYNTPLKEYILRQVEKDCDFISSIVYFKESDNSLFLYLEEELNSSKQLVIITTKQNFSTVGKVISTVTSDNQIVKDNMLIPSKADLFEEKSYLLAYKNSITNVIYMDEMQKMPELLLNFQNSNAVVQIFEETKQNTFALLNPIAQTYDVYIDIIELVDGWLRVDVRSKKYGNISKFINSAKNLFKEKMISSSNIPAYIIDILSKNDKKLTFAESCSGGLLSYYFTSQNGASKVLDGSLITYSNSLKENWLAVEHTIIERNGAVSYEVVQEMSDGAINVSNADYALSISGIAGDTGGSAEKPIGTVYIGVRSKTKHQEEHLNLQGDRNYVQQQSVLFAIKMLLLIDKEMFF
jgi:nicotinamide-nucleotide amidase